MKRTLIAALVLLTLAGGLMRLGSPSSPSAAPPPDIPRAAAAPTSSPPATRPPAADPALAAYLSCARSRTFDAARTLSALSGLDLSLKNDPKLASDPDFQTATRNTLEAMKAPGQACPSTPTGAESLSSRLSALDTEMAAAAISLSDATTATPRLQSLLDGANEAIRALSLP